MPMPNSALVKRLSLFNWCQTPFCLFRGTGSISWDWLHFNKGRQPVLKWCLSLNIGAVDIWVGPP